VHGHQGPPARGDADATCHHGRRQVHREELLKQGYEQLRSDPCLFLKRVGSGFILLYGRDEPLGPIAMVNGRLRGVRTPSRRGRDDEFFLSVPCLSKTSPSHDGRWSVLDGLEFGCRLYRGAPLLRNTQRVINLSVSTEGYKSKHGADGVWRVKAAIYGTQRAPLLLFLCLHLRSAGTSLRGTTPRQARQRPR
jgi:hypothetical protein